MGVGKSGGRRGNDEMNVEINLVPFIDFLTVLISFLLLTAVWTELGKIETQQTVDGGSGGGEKPEKLNVAVTPGGYDLELPGDQGNCSIPKKGTSYDLGRLKSVLSHHKSTSPGSLTVGIAAIDDLRFELLVQVMDICSALELKSISLGQLVAPPEGGGPCEGG